MKLTYSSQWLKKPSTSLFYEKVKHTLLTMSSSEDKYFTRALRTTLIVLFTLQLVSTLERQVFDFLGYMWAPIIGNFFQIIIVILGLFGACNFYRSFIVVYTVWNLLWLGWNIFVICLYLEVGILNRNKNLNILTIGADGKSWWMENGIGCKVEDDANTAVGEDEQNDVLEVTSGDSKNHEDSVDGCILQYYYVEVIHAAVQVLLSVIGFVVSIVSIYLSVDEEYSMSSANDELEFVKMRYRAPTHVSSYREDREAMAFDNLNLTTEFTPDEYPVSRSRSHHGSMRSVDHRERGATGRRGDREQPPSYDTTMRNAMDATVAASNYYVSDRQSVRSKASTRSKRNNRSQGRGAGAGDIGSGSGGDGSATYSDPRRDLPWVQITPSTNHQDSHHNSMSTRNYFV